MTDDEMTAEERNDTPAARKALKLLVDSIRERERLHRETMQAADDLVDAEAKVAQRIADYLRLTEPEDDKPF